MLDRLFNPRSIAIIGASNNARKSGGNFVKSLIDYRYKGDLFPVNPATPEIMGLKAYPSIADTPGPADLAIITIPAQGAPAALKACADREIPFVIVHTAGFSELGPEGRALQDKLEAAIVGSKTRVVGPNCLGLYCPGARISTIMTDHTSGDKAREPGPVSLVAQSGWATESMITEGFERGLRFSKIISIGNQCDLTAADFIDYLGGDPNTGVIAAYLEGVKNGRGLLAAARKASRTKPVIVWKSGKTAAGARAAASHTGSLAGREAVTRAALRQAGVLTVDSIFELIDLAAAFSGGNRPTGRRVGVLVEAGGGAVAAADALERCGLLIQPFSDKTQARITSFLTGIGSPKPSPRNPVDLVWPPMDKIVQIITTSVEIMAAECDVVLWVTYCPIGDETFAATLKEVQQKVGKPLVAVPALPSEHRKTMDVFLRQGMPTFSRIERAARAIQAMVEFEENRKNNPA